MSTTPRDSQDDADRTAPEGERPADATPPAPEPAPEPPGGPEPSEPEPEAEPPGGPAPSEPEPEPDRPTAPPPPTAPMAPPPPPGATAADARPPATAADAAGQHAAPRPYPPTFGERPAAPDRPVVPGPGEAPSPAAAPPGPEAAAVPLVAPAAPLVTQPPTAPPAQPPTHEPTETPAEPAPVVRSRRDVPEAPAKVGVGRHVLAGLLGLILTPVALLLVGVGIARLADIAGTDDMGSDALGLSLLILGVVMLAAIVLLGAWSAAMPIVGGLVWGIALGAAYLAVPDAMEDAIASMTADGSVPAPVDQLAEAAMSGYLVVVGGLLVTAGIAASVARRRGRRWGAQKASYEQAQADRDAARATDDRLGRPVVGRDGADETRPVAR